MGTEENKAVVGRHVERVGNQGRVGEAPHE